MTVGVPMPEDVTDGVRKKDSVTRDDIPPMSVIVAVLLGIAMICATVITVAAIHGAHGRDREIACYSNAKTADEFLACKGIETDP